MKFKTEFLLIVMLFSAISLFAQPKKDDSQIIVTFADTANKWVQAKNAFIREGFQVWDIPGDTVRAYPRGFKNIGVIWGLGIIKGNTLILSGIYGFKLTNLMGNDIVPKKSDVIHISYYKASKTWKILMNIANRLGSDISYSK